MFHIFPQLRSRTSAGLAWQSRVLLVSLGLMGFKLVSSEMVSCEPISEHSADIIPEIAQSAILLLSSMLLSVII